MNHLQKARVSADFPMHERDILQLLCEQDFRPPAEQLRWLVLTEAQRRGILPSKNNRYDTLPSTAGVIAVQA